MYSLIQLFYCKSVLINYFIIIIIIIINCMEYKRNVVWTTTKLKDKAIRNFFPLSI